MFYICNSCDCHLQTPPAGDWLQRQHHRAGAGPEQEQSGPAGGSGAGDVCARHLLCHLTRPQRQRYDVVVGAVVVVAVAVAVVLVVQCIYISCISRSCSSCSSSSSSSRSSRNNSGSNSSDGSSSGNCSTVSSCSSDSGSSL